MRSRYIIICIMGCTSSAPSVSTPEIHTTTGQTVKFVATLDDKDKSQENITLEDQNETNDSIKVLPKCDIVVETIQVVRNIKSSTDLPCLDNVKVNQEMENNGNNPPMEMTHDNKITSLEKIVEQVIVTNIMDNIHKSESLNPQNEDQENHNNKEQTITVELNDIPLNENEEEMQKDEQRQEAPSPDQSISSRVTRWEALADIAAELPPSLAVDPITGQIYSLSK